MYDGATLKVTVLFSKVILLSMFVYGDCIAVCSIHLLATGVAELAGSTHLKGCPHTFVCTVEVSSLRTLRLESLKHVFQPLT